MATAYEPRTKTKEGTPEAENRFFGHRHQGADERVLSAAIEKGSLCPAARRRQEEKMAKQEGRLVPVDELPKRSRNGKYARVIDDFRRGSSKYARYESSGKASNVAAALRAAAKSSGAPVDVKVIGGEVYLQKK
jgi:hypothetical protein